MNKYISLLVALIVTLFAANSFAFTPPPAPANGGYVSDQAGKLTEAQISQLNSKIERANQATKNEFGVLLLQDMGGDNIEDVANATFKAWGVGKRGLDNGVLIVVAIKERKSRIETGKGTEGEITDLQASDILKKNLNPHLKSGDFFGGFNETVDAVSSLMESRAQKAAPITSPATGTSPAIDSASDSSGSIAAVIFMVFVGLGILCLVVVLLAANSAEKRRQKEREEELENIQMAREREQERRKRVELEKKRQLRTSTPLTDFPITGTFTAPSKSVPLRPTKHAKPVIHVPKQPLSKEHIKPAEVAIAGSAVAAAVATESGVEMAHRFAEARRKREREEDEERSRRKRREEEESSSSSSSSSFDWGGGSSGSDSGGGFGGGDSGGGGSSSDW